MTYELWETAAGNTIDVFATKLAALVFVRSQLNAYGSEYVESWALLAVDGSSVDGIAAGAALAALARNPVAA